MIVICLYHRVYIHVFDGRIYSGKHAKHESVRDGWYLWNALSIRWINSRTAT